MSDQQIKIGLYETGLLISPDSSLSPGTYSYRVNANGNALVSTVYVKSGTGTVTARWHDSGAATEINPGYPGSDYTLLTHPALTAGQQDRRLVSNIHNHPRLEIVVSGGSAVVGVYVTVTSAFTVQSNALFLDGQTAALGTDGGQSVAVYDPADGKWYALRGSHGVPKVTIDGAIEAEITGPIDVNVLGTVPVTNAGDPTSVLDGETANLATQKGIPGFSYDPSDGKWYAVRSKSGDVFVRIKDDSVKAAILKADDRHQNITYADFGTVNQRVVRIDYTSATVFLGSTARKDLAYTLVGTRYRRDSINWSIV